MEQFAQTGMPKGLLEGITLAPQDLRRIDAQGTAPMEKLDNVQSTLVALDLCNERLWFRQLVCKDLLRDAKRIPFDTQSVDEFTILLVINAL